MEEKNVVELTDHRAMIYIPENAVEITLTAKVYHEGKIIEVHKVIGMSEIREACRKADDGYIDDDDRFEITEKGLQWLEEHRNSED